MINYKTIKKPKNYDEELNKLIEQLQDEQVYDFAVELRNDIEELTNETISEWSNDFDTILDISRDYLTNHLDLNDFNISEINSELKTNQINEIISKVATRLRY